MKYWLFSIYRSIARTIYFVLFTIIEYVRSGRIALELIASGAFFYLFFFRHREDALDIEHFLMLTSIFSLVLTIYTMSSVISMGDRPQCYVLLAQRLKRSNFLVGLYVSALLLVICMYILISISTIALYGLEQVNVGLWALSSVPLMLNVGLFMALLLILSPLVFSTGWRLFFLGIIALAFSRNFDISGDFGQLPSPLRELLSILPLALSSSLVSPILESMQTILSWPLIPSFSGFVLATSPEVSIRALLIIVAQTSLLIALLSISTFAFSRRDIVFALE